LGSLWPLESRQPAALEKLGRHLLATERTTPDSLNAIAWIMATESDASRDQLEVAVDLAEQAVALTGRSNPDVLDTLAEVHFARGDDEQAVEVMLEALEISPNDPYLHEQLRRFQGKRPAEDRPDPETLRRRGGEPRAPRDEEQRRVPRLPPLFEPPWDEDEPQQEPFTPPENEDRGRDEGEWL
jgi:tetratricopeptide (TPR) repeat protein